MLTAAPKLALLPALFFLPALLAQTAPPPPAPASPAAATAAAPRVDHQDSFTVVCLTVRTNNEAEAGGQGKIPPLWEHAIEGNVFDPIPNRIGTSFVVVYSDYAGDFTGDYNYTLGVRVSSADKLPDGFVTRTIHAGQYAVISSETGPPQQVIPTLWRRINSMTPQDLGGTRAYQTDFETYANFTDPGSMQVDAHIGLK